MKWQGRRMSENVEDRRGQSGAGGFGGNLGGLLGGSGSGCGIKGGLGVLVIALVVWLMGGNPLQVLSLIGDIGNTGIETTTGYTPSAEEDQMAQFIEVVLADTEDVWTAVFKKYNLTYRKPTLVLFSGATSSPCGTANSATGPFYCSADEKIYVDLSFFDEMKNQLKAGGDFAYAYVIAHEVGHHVQKLLGTLDKVNDERAKSNTKRSNQLSVSLELQADFYAGVWAYHTESMFNSLETGDIDEALNAASQIGDDRLQEQAQGYSVPDSFTHGTSKQRHDWFYKGYRSGDINQGDTFNSK